MLLDVRKLGVGQRPHYIFKFLLPKLRSSLSCCFVAASSVHHGNATMAPGSQSHLGSFLIQGNKEQQMVTPHGSSGIV